MMATNTVGLFGGKPAVGGALMLEQLNLIENAINSPVHTTLVAA